GAGRAVDAGDIARTIDIADAAAQHCLRAAEHQAVVEAADRQRISAPMKIQYAATAGAADDPARLVDRERNGAAVGMRRRGETGAGESSQSKQRGTEGGWYFHMKVSGILLRHRWRRRSIRTAKCSAEVRRARTRRVGTLRFAHPTNWVS